MGAGGEGFRLHAGAVTPAQEEVELHLAYRWFCRLDRQAAPPFDVLGQSSVGFHHAGIDRKAFAIDKTRVHAGTHDGLEHLPQYIALPEAAMASRYHGVAP